MDVSGNGWRDGGSPNNTRAPQAVTARSMIASVIRKNSQLIQCDQGIARTWMLSRGRQMNFTSPLAGSTVVTTFTANAAAQRARRHQIGSTQPANMATPK